MKTDEQTTTPDTREPLPWLLPPLLPRLNVDERAALRPMAFALLAAAEVTGKAAQKVGTMQPTGFYQACLVATTNALSAGASALCVLSASITLALTTDGEEPAKGA